MYDVYKRPTYNKYVESWKLKNGGKKIMQIPTKRKWFSTKVSNIIDFKEGQSQEGNIILSV